jgi:putative hydrolase of the HAD superfamily
MQIEHLKGRGAGLARDLVAGFRAMTEEGWARARETLTRLRPAARLGVVSNFYGNLDVLLEEAGLAPFLDVVVESTKVGLEKPDPRIYRLAVERLGLDAGDVAMVGDNFERDVRPAKSIGMRTVWLRRGEREAPEPAVADRVVARLADVGSDLW